MINLLSQLIYSGKTIMGSIALVAVALLNHYGVQTDATQIATIAGVAVTVAGCVHKIIKANSRVD